MRTVRMSGPGWGFHEVLVAQSFIERYRGIRAVDSSVYFGIKARLVHTVGLSRPIEAFALDKRGTVVHVRSLRPNRFFHFPSAVLVVEMPEGCEAPSPGSVLEMSHV